MRVVCVIPARLSSKRFPRKILSSLLEKPLLVWVYEAALKTGKFDRVVFAIDSVETAKLLDHYDLPYHMTPESLPSGTDRLAYVCQQGLEKGDFWVNWQADEPLISKKMIEDLLSGPLHQKADVYTLKKTLESESEIFSPHICKLVTDKMGRALYFSRSPIPASRDGEWDYKKFYKHVGLYAFPEKTLLQFGRLESCPYEEDEKLEQLRFLYNGLTIHLALTHEEAIGIDLPEHLERVEERLKTIAFNI